jgi:hypothetical protein
MKALPSEGDLPYVLFNRRARNSWLGVQQFTQVALPHLNESPRVPNARSDGFRL